ncbi:hypothetical protein Slin15195_G029060 [Septoria linicola]|uniref:Protein CASP n=1 Tax=Septoria linicola TaxID=215465 RepID=A0A9Q9AP86_9PEZI|nr:hypothetical protein Slin14017_G028090 [Septoria linicola]USW49587.1 hypothetical protein Slin15195_G029060 [Septoria linicola]
MSTAAEMEDDDLETTAGAAPEVIQNGGNAANATEEEISDNSNSNSNTTADAGNKFQQAVAAWRSLDLTALVSNLDTTAEDMVTQQKHSLLKRKELATKTKEFRKMDDSAKLSEMMGLLKMYQGYIDLLSNQNKAVSAAFMSAYSPLSEAPDPYPLLDASIDSLVTADEVVPRLESENDRLAKQVSKQNTQLEVLEKQLEQERTTRQSLEASQGTKIKEVEESWSAVLKEKEDNWASKERSLEEKVENQDRLLKELKASYEVSQRLEKTGEENQDAGRNAAAAAELEIVNQELERTNIRLAEVEARNEHMRTELAQSAGQSSAAKSTSVEDDPAYQRLRSENSSLLRRLDASRHDRDSDKTKLENTLRGLERELTTLKADRDALQSRVQKWRDYDEVKRELDMLRAIEFSSIDDADVTGETSMNGKAGESLEQLLVARNKKLSDELTELRVSHRELQQRLEQLQEDLSSTNMELEQTQKLNATLENDLQKTQQEASNALETMSVAGTYTSRFPKSHYGSRRGRGASPTSSIIGGFDPTDSGSQSPRLGNTLESLRAGEAVGGGSGILPMVTAQRDRFKKKIGELEQELQKQYQTVSSLRGEIASLQKDNLNLYEKTRYVSTYNRTATSGASYGGNPNPSTVQVGGSDDRYRSAYEANISPFQAFRGRESARALKRMSLPERAVFQFTRMVLATRTSRNLFALYCVGLHLLVFIMLYYMGSADATAHASSLSTSSLKEQVEAVAAAGGAEAHGDWQAEGFEAGA